MDAEGLKFTFSIKVFPAKLEQSHSVKPKKWLGQHFLVDKNALAFIVRQANLKKEDIVLEIGPGKGVLTRELAKQADRVYALEIDPNLVKLLKEEFQGKPGVKIFLADALKTNLYQLFSDETFPGKLVSNLPYNLASTLILDFLEKYPEIKTYLVMIQKEVALRITASPGLKDYGAYTLKIGFFSEVELLRTFPREIFQPPPRVDSALVRIKRKAQLPQVDYERFKKLVEASFSHRRKKLVKNLASNLGIPRGSLFKVLSTFPLDTESRPENLSFSDYLSLAIRFQKEGWL